MCRVSIFFLFLLIIEIGSAGEIFNMKSFDRKNLEIEDNWSAKEVSYKDSELITFLRKNLGVSKISEHPELDHMVYLTIMYEPDNAQGFPSKEDNEKMSDFEDIDIPKIEHESNSIHVASVLENGVKYLLFYVSDFDDFLKSVNKNNSRLKSFKIDLELSKDPKWEIYHDFP